MSGIPAIVVSVITFVIIGLAALGVGANSRRVGYRLPWVSGTGQTWISGHRAAFLVVGPTSTAATILYMVNANSGFAQALPSPLGWFLWLAGVLVGGVVAIVRARYVLRKQTA
ncbi:hypothetical protein SAMN06295879_3437 [Agreia bicolorata]|uniref:Uncharacterized protein n=1 Tax=Agreia bicolorata TaxID=110935 RepID=A0A1T4YJS7_9MICO|nr:hypothetical protein [Agreia bicolorata]SKB02107.1 hypothetical protein SAMN06295879_3437 [Agreia bicolorata]